MYDKLTIRNFQSHKNTTLEFHSGVNAIVGVTDSGKSVIRRALEWVQENKPSGDVFRSCWGGETRVSLKTNGKMVSRIKGFKGDLYKIDKEKFKSFGRKVPPEVQAVLNMHPDNVQTQLESLFLLNDSAGKVALHYNGVANLGQINEVRDSLQKDINGFSQTVKFNEKEIEKNKNEAKKYTNLDLIEKELSAVVRLEKKALLQNKNIKEIKGLLNAVSEIDSEIKELDGVLDGEGLVDECLPIFAELKKLSKELINIKGVLYAYESLIDEQKKLNKLADKKTRVDTALIALKKAKQLKAEISTLTELLGSIALTNRTVVKKREKLTELKKTYNKGFSKLKKCPLCGSALK